MKNQFKVSNVKKRRRHYGRLGIMLAGILCVSLLLIVPADDADAMSEIKEIRIAVGYPGLGPEDGYTKVMASIDDMAETYGTHQEIYTWVNMGSACGTTEAEGIYITDIMDYCGIDMDSVYTYNFFTQDSESYAESNKQWMQDQLFCTRYTFASVFQRAIDEYNEDPDDYVRNPERHFTVDDIFDYDNTRAYTNYTWDNRESVEPMLALQTHSVTWKNYVPAANLDFSVMSENGKPILVFGQAGKNDITRNAMAQMVYEIRIWFEGSPSIMVEEMDFSGEVGTTGSVGVTVETPDEALSAAILADLTYTSSNNQVATVDEAGNVEIIGEGDASISVSYNGTVYGTVGASGIPEEEKEPDSPREPGSGDGDGSGKGTDGSGGGEGNTSGSGDNAGNNGGGDSQTGNGASDDGGSTGKDSSGLSGTETGGISSGQSSKASSKKSSGKAVQTTGGISSGKTTQQSAQAAEHAGIAGDTGGGESDVTIADENTVYEITPNMSADTALTESIQDNKLLRRALLVGLIALIIGVAAESVYFRNQTMWIKRAKRVYERK